MSKKQSEPTVQITIRLPKSMLAKIDKRAAQVNKQNNLNLGRLDMIRSVLQSAFAQ